MVVVGPALAAVVGLGAVGGILANIALTPLTAGASVLQSYWYGAGLILGERMMYTVHWEQIKERLDKGEDFLQVLDAIMNRDITAIANLSFKAMEQTGELYLNAASESIGAFIEKLLLAMLTANPTGIIPPAGEEDPPAGEETDDGISFTITQLQAMNLAQIEAILSDPSIYTDQTIAHAKTVKAQKLLDAQDEFEQTQIKEITMEDFQTSEKDFLSSLGGTDMNSFINWFTSLEAKLQTFLTSFFREKAYFIGMSVRTQSATTDAVRDGFSQLIIDFRTKMFATSDDTALRTFQYNINALQVLIYFHNLVYSR